MASLFYWIVTMRQGTVRYLTFSPGYLKDILSLLSSLFAAEVEHKFDKLNVSECAHNYWTIQKTNFPI